MSEPVILISRLWINRWQPGHRGAHCSNLVIALAFGAQAAKLFDVGPRRPGRKKLSALLTPAMLGEPLMPGFTLDLRIPDAKMSMDSASAMDGVRIERCLFELKVSMPMAQSDLELEESSRRFAGVMGKALEPWLGPPLALRAQVGRESASMFATGGDLGIIAAYQSSGSMPGRPADFAAWRNLLAEVAALGQAEEISISSPSLGKSATKLPRL